LADYLIELPVDYTHFRMSIYNQDSLASFYTEGVDPRGCGTAACAVGHVPYTGIVGWETQHTWNDVAANLLGADPKSDDRIFPFLFGSANVDCPWAAALRIRHFLETGSVEGFEYPHGLTLEQYQNLRRLAAYLIALPEDYREFDMAWWTDDYTRYAEDSVCGTVACAGGHGPRAGIAALPGEDWEAYISRAFTGRGNAAFEIYIFGANWKQYDNTPQGAGKRILYALHNDLPTGDRRYDTSIYGG